jgi:hypothetical protein
VHWAENLADYLEILGDLTSCPGLEWDSFIQSIWHNPVADAVVNRILKSAVFSLTALQVSARFGRHQAVAKLLCS